jgi:hypothetical protein
MIEYLPLVLTGIGIIVSILYYTSVLRNANKTQQMHLETRQAQLLMQVYNKYDTPDKQEAFVDMFFWQWDDFDDFLRKYGPENPEKFKHFRSLITYFEGIGTLVRSNKLPIEEIYHMMGGASIQIWGNFMEIIDEFRDYWNYPRLLSETEYLYYELIKFRDNHPELL